MLRDIDLAVVQNQNRVGWSAGNDLYGSTACYQRWYSGGAVNLGNCREQDLGKLKKKKKRKSKTRLAKPVIWDRVNK